MQSLIVTFYLIKIFMLNGLCGNIKAGQLELICQGMSLSNFVDRGTRGYEAHIKKIYSIYILLDPYNLDQKHDWGNRMEKIILGKKKKYIFSKNSLII